MGCDPGPSVSFVCQAVPVTPPTPLPPPTTNDKGAGPPLELGSVDDLGDAHRNARRSATRSTAEGTRCDGLGRVVQLLERLSSDGAFLCLSTPPHTHTPTCSHW